MTEAMPAVCIYFQVHQPYRLKKYTRKDIGVDSTYFSDTSRSKSNNRHMLKRVARRCYIPATEILLELVKRHPEFKLSLSFSGILLEQLEEYSPETMALFRRLVNSDKVELLGETYYHSLAFVHSLPEFVRQVKLHTQKINKVFGVSPRVFRNTELIYNDQLARTIEKMGFKGILAEGADKILGERSPNFVYKPAGTEKIKLMMKDYRLSDDIAFRFSEPRWPEYPLTAAKFASWIKARKGKADVINLFMDYETFGEHHWRESKILEFLRQLPPEILAGWGGQFVTPSEAVESFQAKGEVNVSEFISWADMERDISAWLGSPNQLKAAARLYALEKDVVKTKNKQLISDWRRMQTSDHFYYMCTKGLADGDIHKFFSPYKSPQVAFNYFMNALADLELRVIEALGARDVDNLDSPQVGIEVDSKRKWRSLLGYSAGG